MAFSSLKASDRPPHDQTWSESDLNGVKPANIVCGVAAAAVAKAPFKKPRRDIPVCFNSTKSPFGI